MVGPRGPVADGHRSLLRCDEAVMLERSQAEHLLLLVGSIEVLDGELTIEGRRRPPFLRKALVKGLALLLLFGCRAERFTGERAVRLLDHRLQLFSRVLIEVLAALDVPVR